ncbi:hypothetical protein [Thioclava sp. GXIMD2076]|uniref:hypothetical protein n=1 Tax=Thioclava sp. GXIMD2076 TaxID=3131931 RepID=UPI0030CFC03D
MPNPIPEHVRAITGPNILTTEEWIRRTEAAKDFLVQRHGYREEDFYTVSDDDEPCLGGWPKYRPEWISQSGFVADQAIPRGLILHCPPGLDITGEPHDTHDPICLLEDAELWASMTDDEIRALCEDPAPHHTGHHPMSQTPTDAPKRIIGADFCCNMAQGGYGCECAAREAAKNAADLIERLTAERDALRAEQDPDALMVAYLHGFAGAKIGPDGSLAARDERVRQEAWAEAMTHLDKPLNDTLSRRMADAATFAAEAYERAGRGDEGTYALRRAFITAMADFMHPGLDYLRADPEAAAAIRKGDA